MPRTTHNSPNWGWETPRVQFGPPPGPTAGPGDTERGLQAGGDTPQSGEGAQVTPNPWRDRSPGDKGHWDGTIGGDSAELPPAPVWGAGDEEGDSNGGTSPPPLGWIGSDLGGIYWGNWIRFGGSQLPTLRGSGGTGAGGPSQGEFTGEGGSGFSPNEGGFGYPPEGPPKRGLLGNHVLTPFIYPGGVKSG